jgi:hypothetical protein
MIFTRLLLDVQLQTLVPFEDRQWSAATRSFLCYILFMASQEEIVQETYKLSRDNNRMLHAMRRNAFIGGIIKIALYAVFLGVPIWFLFTYVSPILNSAVSTLDQVQGQVQNVQNAGSQVTGGIGGLLDQLKKIPGIGNFGE